MAKFDDKLVLGSWMLEQFGVQSLASLKEFLADSNLVGFDEENNTLYLHELLNRPFLKRAMSDDQLRSYDDNIVKHWRQITEGARNHSGDTLYPLYFQYLSLLFTEHYLDRYFDSRQKLLDDLNTYLVGFNGNLSTNEEIQPFQEEDLNKLAVWIATGGGKTLLMHVNILQFQHYLKRARKEKSFNRIILLTPNEGLSRQHLGEFGESGFHGAGLFNKDGGQQTLVGTGDVAIDILDIHKLEETSGDKTVAVDTFESNNLVLVDEGHRGASGEKWLDKRNRLCSEGFSFEYSATFGQAIKAASGTDAPRTEKQRESSKKYKLIQQYSKCILFDYSYKFFHEDGYGKDHSILNLQKAWSEEQQRLYLTGCVLAFFQQKKLFVDKKKVLKPYLLHDPLWIFVGGKVTASGGFSSTKFDTGSDVQQILRFLSNFLSTPTDAIKDLDRLLAGSDGLLDGRNQRVFHGAFDYLASQYQADQAADLYQHILDTVFHAVSSGDLHVIHLKGSGGEIGLRVGDGDWFGVINVGDSAKLIQICEGMSRRIVVSDQQFSSTLFHTINDKGSSINLLIGAKKFSEGWSSWRVSTMGLMNVGKSEGSEIIQLFGRGVRLKGYDFTLKRSSHIHTHKHPMYLGYLETLNVFGVNSNYMDEFKDYLEEEGVGEGATETITLPVIANLDRNDLKIIRPKDDLPDFKKAEKPILMRPPAKMKSRVVLDWYPKIQSRSTKKGGSGGATTRDEVVLGPKHLAFIDSEALWFDLEQFKGDKAYYNLQIDRSIVDDLLNDSGWYTLYVQKNEMDIAGFDRIHVWQEIALALLKKYCESYYRFCKNRYEAPHLEYQLLDASDPNFFEEYEATIHRDEQAWIDKLNELKTKLTDGSFKNQWKYNGLTAIEFTRHLYKPLIHFHNNDVLKIAPVSLNDGERDFVQDLKDWYRKSSHQLEGKDLYLLRNQSKGKGVGFFDAGNFYPDFILWLIDGKRQHVLFIDPKGLLRIQGFGDPKISFCKEIKNLENLLNDSDVTLESFIVSNTKMSDISWWSDGEDLEKDFANNHVLFQKDHSGTYIQSMMSAVL